MQPLFPSSRFDLNVSQIMHSTAISKFNPPSKQSVFYEPDSEALVYNFLHYVPDDLLSHGPRM